MNEEKIEYSKTALDTLIKKYPITFNNACFESIWFIPNGWMNLIDDLCKDISTILEESYSKFPQTDENPGFSILQIKEKFGSLRFYFNVISEDVLLYDKIQNLVDAAEVKSETVCEATGKDGKMCKKGLYFHTLNEDVAKKHGFKPIN